MAPKIVPLLPPHTVYVEPFLGSGAVMFEKGIPSGSPNHYREVLNDKNELLIGFFRVLQEQNQSEELRVRLAHTLYSRAEYMRAVELCKSPVGDSVLMAWAWFVNLAMSFASKSGGGWGTSVVYRNHARTLRRDIERISEYTQRLKYAYIESAAALEVIGKWDSPQTLHYIDPPYPDTGQGHYSGFSQTDFEELIAALQDCSGSVVLSCYNNPAVPSNWEKYEFRTMASSKGITGANRNHSAKSKARSDAGRVECVWIKSATGNIRPELKEAMERHAGQRKQLSFEEELL